MTRCQILNPIEIQVFRKTLGIPYDTFPLEADLLQDLEDHLNGVSDDN